MPPHTPGRVLSVVLEDTSQGKDRKWFGSGNRGIYHRSFSLFDLKLWKMQVIFRIYFFFFFAESMKYSEILSTKAFTGCVSKSVDFPEYA